MGALEQRLTDIFAEIDQAIALGGEQGAAKVQFFADAVEGGDYGDDG